MAAMQEMKFAEVAIPVPLRRLFTYRIPDTLLEQVKPGSRVAVAFQRRKVAGIVVRLRDSPPEGVTRIVNISGLLEPEPIFPSELLHFLDEAARYYFHPLGEVLRAAAPAVPKGALRRLKQGGFLTADESLGTSIAERRELFIQRVAVLPEDVRLGAAQARLLTAILPDVETPLGELRAVDKRARTIVRGLVEKGLVTVEERVVRGGLFASPIERDTPPTLNEAQRFAVDAIVKTIGTGGQFLLHGVTGSGKTEVYLHAIDTARKQKRGSLLLVPEIALTPQLVSRFRARFGDDIAVLHSALSVRERDDAWRRLRAGDVDLAIGARSALFAPVPDLGLIVVDEEHDPSFKQEEGFRYQARDMALLRGHRAGATVVLGSATPSIEAFHRSESGAATLLSLPVRATGQSMPAVEILDLRRTKARPGRHPQLSGPLEEGIRTCLEAGDQAILFLNRRGFAPSVRCLGCGQQFECPSCSVALTEHRRASRLRCHYCDFERSVPDACTECGSTELGHIGLGTEQLEDSLAELFAPARVARLDRDSASGRGVEEVLRRLREREVDLLVGTQMVTKGHDIPGVTLVGVISADQALGFPDFRATERTFQLLAQVAGRAGRGEKPGTVIFQTYDPEHFAIRAAAGHDYDAFYQAEIRAREELSYPPYGWMAAIRADAPSEDKVSSVIESLAGVARSHPACKDMRVLLQGPVPAPIARIRGRFRYRFFLRSEDRRALRAVSAAVARAIDDISRSTVRASLDIDPVSML